MRSFVLLFVATLGAAAPRSQDNQPIEPFRIADNLYYVGSSDIGSYLITSHSGHILIDAGYVETVPLIQANIARLGYKLADVKVLLNTQAHFDHAGGFAEMKRLTGASLMASAADAEVIENGGRGDFNLGDTRPFPAVTVDRRLEDRDTVRVGGVVLTAHLTPGHTKGCTTWTLDVTDRGRTYHVVDVCGVAILDGTRVSGMPAYPQIAADYAKTFDELKKLPCDIFIGAHAGYYGGLDKAATLRAHPDGPNPFVDPHGYRAFVDAAEKRYREQLAREAK
jgi:metallo-beta-lactamase class B